MIEDLRDGHAPCERDADLCIVGAGPAGLALAQAFAHSRFRVVVLESGGLHCEPEAQALLAGRSAGDQLLAPELTRLRALGGSCRLWGGGCMPLSRAEMAPREWVADSGWPIAYADLAGHYRSALLQCGLHPDGLDPHPDVHVGRRRASLAAGDLVDRPFLRSRVEFGRAARRTLADARNVHVLLHAHLLELQATADAHAVQCAVLAAPDDRRMRIRARHYVLAAGGIENARLLLLSRSVAPAGLGNGCDQVGRWFQEHPRCRIGTLSPGRLAPLLRGYGRNAAVGGPRYRELALSDDAQRERKLLSARLRPYALHAPPTPGMQALRELRAACSPRRASTATLSESQRCEQAVAAALDAGLPAAITPPDPATVRPARAVVAALSHPGDIACGTVRALRSGTHLDTTGVALEAYFEQAPNPDSRVLLDDTCDRLGQPQVKIEWRMTALDHATHRQTAGLFGQALATACAARFTPEPWLDDPQGAPRLHASAHHMGTTRMSDAPATGVVDTQCRVHGVDNLFVAGSSVFPTSAWAFPTLTIVALSLRLAEHLRTRLEAAESLAHLLGA